MNISFKNHPELKKELKNWWYNLQNQKGDRASFCRAKGVTDIILLPEFHRACSRFRPFFSSESNWEDRLASILGLCSHVREETEDKKLAEAMAEGDPAVSELRFRRLIQQDRKDLYISMIRILRMLNSKANLYDLADSIYYWGPERKKNWASSYFKKLPDKK